MFDLLISGGQIVDGTGNVGFYGAVAVDGERVRILRGDVSDIEAARVIDASGRVVCPGFIDFHAHSEEVGIGGRNARRPDRSHRGPRSNRLRSWPGQGSTRVW